MRQAIQTKYFGPTNVKGSRIRARAQAGGITLDLDHAMNMEQNHKAAARKLAHKMGWTGVWSGGGLHDGSYVFTTADSDDFVV